jgi:hypothetical protein
MEGQSDWRADDALDMLTPPTGVVLPQADQAGLKG